jgi:AraC-like DNA-binding protein
MQNAQNWHLKFWRLPHLENVEFLHASHITHDYPPHMHEEYSIAVILRGTETTVCNRSSYTARRGDLLLINADQVHENRSVNSEYRLFKIWPDAFTRIWNASSSPCHLHFPNVVVNDQLLSRALLKLHVDLEREGPALEQESQFISTMAFLLERQTGGQLESSSKRKEQTKVRLIREYLRDHYAENISLSELTSLTNLSPFYLLRVFHHQAGFPPHEYQTQVRIAHARRLIRAGAPLAQIAAETGFFDQSHLSRNFKRIVGVTPRQYFRGETN